MSSFHAINVSRALKTSVDYRNFSRRISPPENDLAWSLKCFYQQRARDRLRLQSLTACCFPRHSLLHQTATHSCRKYETSWVAVWPEDTPKFPCKSENEMQLLAVSITESDVSPAPSVLGEEVRLSNLPPRLCWFRALTIPSTDNLTKYMEPGTVPWIHSRNLRWERGCGRTSSGSSAWWSTWPESMVRSVLRRRALNVYIRFRFVLSWPSRSCLLHSCVAKVNARHSRNY